MSAEAGDPANTHCVVLSTARDEEEASRLASGIIAGRLGACVQIVTVRSLYTWHGENLDEPEALMLIKTRLDAYEALESFILANHSYETPEILALPVVVGSIDYLTWMNGEIGN